MGDECQHANQGRCPAFFQIRYYIIFPVLQTKCPQVSGENGSSSSKLSFLPEEDEPSEVDNREKELLIERIQSIKEEK